jgi:hypothetical protein
MQMKSAVSAARIRVQTRIDTAELLSNESFPTSSDTIQETKIMKKIKVSNASKKTPLQFVQSLDLKKFIDSSGELTLELKTHLSTENPNKIISAKNANMTLQSFNSIVDNYLKPWQLSKIYVIDLMGNRLGLNGAILLSSKLQKGCKLIHLNLNGMDIGDMGLKKVLSAIESSGGEKIMLRLDIQSNGITIATETFSMISKFINLR